MIGRRLRYDEVSYFYCEMGELGFDMLGIPENAEDWISRGDLKDGSYALFYLRDDVPQAAFSMGRPSSEIRVAEGDRKSVVSGKSVSVRVDLGGRRIINKNNRMKQRNRNYNRAKD